MNLQDLAIEKSQAKSYTIKQKLLGSVSSFVKGPAQAYLNHTWGLLGSFFGAIGFTCISATNNYLDFHQQKQNLVNCYRDELAVLLKRDRQSITLADLKDYIAQPGAQRTPIAVDYANLNTGERAAQIKSFLKNIVISAAVTAFVSLSGASLGMMMYAAIGAITLSCDIIGDTLLEKWQAQQKPTSVPFVKYIQVEMAKGIVDPQKLFQYAIQANPQIENFVKKTFNENYNTLSYQKKIQVIDMLGMRDQMERMAADLNNGTIRATELPFLLAGQNSPSTHLANYASPRTQEVTRSVETAAQLDVAQGPANKVHSARLEAELQERVPSLQIH